MIESIYFFSTVSLRKDNDVMPEKRNSREKMDYLYSLFFSTLYCFDALMLCTPFVIQAAT